MSSDEHVIESYRVVGLPKGSVLWPTAAAAIILGILSIIFQGANSLFATIFLIIFGINLLILFFDFARGAVIGIFGLIVAAISLMYALEIKFPLRNALSKDVFTVSPTFLILYGVVYMVLFLSAYLISRSFDYYVFSSNELVRKSGILGDAVRYNAPNLEISKDIVDVFESLILFGAGDLKIRTTRGEQFVIRNVPRINKAEKEIRHLLSKLEVDTN